MENDSKQNDPTIASVDAADAPLVDQVLRQPEREAPLTVFEEADLSQQLSAMRMEANQIAESIKLLAEGATSMVRKMPTELEEQMMRQFQENPIKVLVATVALSFGVTLSLLGRRVR
jgi:superfamily II DNA helicase RecQ